MVKVFAIYLLLAGVPVIGIVVLLGLGQTLQAPVSPASDVSGWQGNAAAGAALMPHLNTLLLQIVVILTTARLVGGLFRKIHQPQVVGEMAAGIILGPSLLGWLAPGVYGALFPAESLGFLSALSQIGLILFMFLVGLELDLRALRGQGRTALLTSHTSIVFPFFLGALLAFTPLPAPGARWRALRPFRPVYGRGAEHYRFSRSGAHPRRTQHVAEQSGRGGYRLRGDRRRNWLVHSGRCRLVGARRRRRFVVDHRVG